MHDANPTHAPTDAASDVAPLVIAAFDCDGTLIRGDATRSFLLSLRGWPGLLLDLLTLLPALLRWRLGRLSTTALKQRLLGLAIQRGRPRLAAVLEPVEGPTALMDRLRPAALERLRWHQRQGHRLVIVTASPRFLIEPLARQLGVCLLATETTDPLAAGPGQPLRLVSPNCKGPEKTRRLAAWLERPLAEVQLHAYGDSRGDRELLQASGHPHWRSFGEAAVAYPPFSLTPLLPVLALALLGYGLLGLWSQGDQLLPLLLRLWPRILAGLLLVLLGYAIRFGRWRLLLHHLDLHPPVARDGRIWMGSYALTATPGKSGEAVRALLLRQECGVPAPPTVVALLVERLTDATAVVLLLLLNVPLLLPWLRQDQGSALTTLALSGALILMLGLAVTGLLRSRRLVQALQRPLRRLLPPQLAGAGRDGLAALPVLLRPAPLLLATVIGALAWSLEGLSLLLLLRGLGVSTIGWGGATLAHTGAGLLGALTLLPGGLGSTEAGTVGLLALQGASLAAATPATLLIRLMTLWFATALGALCLLWPRRHP